MLAVFLSPPCPLLHRFLVWPRARPNQNWKSHKKTASYINAGYKICSLHFWSFGSFSWSFRGCVFVIKPRCTTRENELETEKKMIKTASYIYAGYEICSLHFWSFVSFSWSFRGCVFVIKPRCTTRENELETEKKMIKTASYIYAGYEICSLHFWSFVSFSWSFRGSVFVIKPRCTRRENELETEKKKTDKYR